MKHIRHKKTALDNIFDTLADEQLIVLSANPCRIKARVGQTNHLKQQKKAIKAIEEKFRKQREEDLSDKRNF